MKDTMSRQTFEIEAQAEKINKLDAASAKTTELLHDLKSDIKVIASWVKQQSGDTLIESRKGH
jgi:cell division protein FtsB